MSYLPPGCSAATLTKRSTPTDRVVLFELLTGKKPTSVRSDPGGLRARQPDAGTQFGAAPERARKIPDYLTVLACTRRDANLPS